MARLSPLAKQPFTDDNGTPLAGGTLTTYLSNTTTPATTYSNKAGTVANTNPIVLDARGEATVYLTPGLNYRFVLKRANGSTVWTRDGISTDSSNSTSILDFDGAGDNTTDNAQAFLNAEASDAPRVYLPEGTYYAAGLGSFQLTKYYYGPGTIRLDGPGYTPGRFTQLMASPTKGTGTDANYYFSGDTSRVEPEYFILGSSNQNVRQSLTEQYFESTTTPHFEYFTNYSGGSGGDARMTVAAPLGATTVTVAGTGGLANGNTIGFYNVSTGGLAHTATITGLTATTVSFSPALPLALGISSTLARGTRTMQQFRFTQLNHNGQGDAYCQTYRVTCNYVPLSGQDHFFYTSTGGVIGGDITHGTDGTYSTTFEFRAVDSGKDCAHISYIQSFTRDYAGASNYGAVWLGTFFKSEGSQYCDAAHVVSGKWKRGLDTTLMAPDAGKAAVNLAADQRVYLNSSATGDPKLGLTHYGNILGGTYFEHSTAVGGYNLVVNNNARFQVTDAEVRSLVDHKLSARLFGTALHNNPAGMAGAVSQFVGSGTYTPTLTNTANVASSTAFECQYLRVGNVVTVSGQITITPTSASVATSLGISLPIASDIVGGRNLGGTACCGAAAGLVGQIAGDPTNDRALLTAVPSTNAANNWSFSFTYLVA